MTFRHRSESHAHFVLAILLVFSASTNLSAVGSENLDEPKGLWLMPRHDCRNTGRASIAAHMPTAPQEIWSYGGEAGAYSYVHKLRDGDVDGLLLLVRDTRTTRMFLDAAEPELRSLFPMSTRTVLGALRRGASPPGNGVVVVPRLRRDGYGGARRPAEF